MAKFLNTSATNYFLEELIKAARERLIIISPFLKFNDRIRELLEDKDRMKIDVRIVYGKSELAPHEINWLRSLAFVRTSFCQNLHAKCYLNEHSAIITSMNLYDFSQVNNNEMGVFVDRDQEADLYRETYEEAQRLIRVSEEVRLSAEKVEQPKDEGREPAAGAADENGFEKLTTSKLAKVLGMRTGELGDKLLSAGLVERDGEHFKLTAKGKAAGGELRTSGKFGPYFLWPADLHL
ncbi:phospholipase D family protein [uncultured Thiodictyon sp.]|jgi:phosphatidylserine/phosphatidylglycerophosphate/cardiolipin synthase-like enzyme|uniref:phospholipase D family protein n=1 Tax=uncultured Thiodictyon sp. TaxID=1846217 RepID=UPI0025F9BF44|nr:phospholipase D family protein [uncultured Thiodictyon sp.]